LPRIDTTVIRMLSPMMICSLTLRLKTNMARPPCWERTRSIPFPTHHA
jgi:hypothetical protein